MPKAKKDPMRSFIAFVLDNHKYSVKDTILVFSGTKSQFIAEIVKIEANPDDSQNATLTLKWFYLEHSSKKRLLFSFFLFVRLIGIGQVKKPWHLCVDDDDRILVCDYRNNRIQVFDQNGGNLCSFELKCLIRRE